MCIYVYIYKVQKNTIDDLVCKAEIEAQKRTNIDTKGEKEDGINWEIELDIYTLPYINYITNKNLLYSTANFIHSTVGPKLEGNPEKGGYKYKHG